MRDSGETNGSTPGGDAPRPVGLKRFVAAKAPTDTPGLQTLRRFLEQREADKKRPGERCELCGQDIPQEHSHIVNIEVRNLLCVCRACYLLFTIDGAARGRYRAVPDRYLFDPEFALTDSEWDDVQIPVGMAFFFRNSAMGKFVAFYPSPAGATESLLDIEAWNGILAANPAMADPEDDVEALLIRKTEGRFQCYLAPIDACYELVGRVKIHWKGFDGGQEVWEEIGTFFDGLRERSRLVDRSSR
jgi:hypothetical protein